MWAASAVAVVALAAVAFMLRFLTALLREGAPSVCYWVVPLCRELKKEEQFKVLRGAYFEDDCRATENERGDYRLEAEYHAKEKCSSGLIALDVRPVSDSLGWRSVHARHGYFLRERRL
jgi:type VI protein secretion system component VasK